VKLLNTPESYGVVSRLLHWVIAFAIVAQWLLAEAERDSMLALHQSIGLIVLALAVVRLAWRWLNPAPAWPADMRPWEITIARAAHVAFYVLLFAIPVSGWALASVEDAPLRLFNWFDVPRIALGTEDTLEDLHEILFNVLAALAVLHVIGAARHWIARRGRRTDTIAG